MPEKNHCGPENMPEFMRKWLSKKFNVACWLHDKHYDDPKTDRFKCDKIFLINMVKKGENDRDIAYAIIYYFSVRIFGKFFKKGKK